MHMKHAKRNNDMTTMTKNEYDEDGDSTTLTPEFRAQLTWELECINVELSESCTEVVRTELQRRRDHITKELSAGRYLPLEA
jgi:hypothetical protein